MTIQTFFKVKKHPSVNQLKFEHELKSKLARPSCVYKEYEVKIKMVQEQWLQLKMKFLLVYYMKILFSGEGINLSGEGINQGK